MKLIVETTNPNAIIDIRNIQELWYTEHLGYYDKHAKWVINGLNWELAGMGNCDVPHPDHRSYEGFRWLTCTGNDHRIAIWGESVILAYNGRRHGMRSEFQNLLKKYWAEAKNTALYITQQPDWNPWDTKLNAQEP